ncbi:MAG: hypothetical protein K0Q43_1914 [Ramlibacter sp.]|nr:hypothetical protein [Ramlibacter sp.]
MPDQSQMSHQFDRNPPAAALVANAYRLSVDEDIALGCECADPALQIERWGQEALQFPQPGA